MHLATAAAAPRRGLRALRRCRAAPAFGHCAAAALPLPSGTAPLPLPRRGLAPAFGRSTLLPAPEGRSALLCTICCSSAAVICCLSAAVICSSATVICSAQ